MTAEVPKKVFTIANGLVNGAGRFVERAWDWLDEVTPKEKEREATLQEESRARNGTISAS